MGFESAGLGWNGNLTPSRDSAFPTSPPREAPAPRPPVDRENSEDQVGGGGGPRTSQFTPVTLLCGFLPWGKCKCMGSDPQLSGNYPHPHLVPEGLFKSPVHRYLLNGYQVPGTELT